MECTLFNLLLDFWWPLPFSQWYLFFKEMYFQKYDLIARWYWRGLSAHSLLSLVSSTTSAVGRTRSRLLRLSQVEEEVVHLMLSEWGCHQVSTLPFDEVEVHDSRGGVELSNSKKWLKFYRNRPGNICRAGMRQVPEYEMSLIQWGQAGCNRNHIRLGNFTPPDQIHTNILPITNDRMFHGGSGL